METKIKQMVVIELQFPKRNTPVDSAIITADKLPLSEDIVTKIKEYISKGVIAEAYMGNVKQYYSPEFDARFTEVIDKLNKLDLKDIL